VSPAAAAEADPVRVDVGLTADADPAAVLAALGESVVTSRPVPNLNAITVDVPADLVSAALSTLGLTPGVRYAERDALVQADGDYLNSGLGASEIPQAWTWTTGSPEITVAVVDTGVSPTADLGADRLLPGYDFVDGDTDAADGDGHGTMVAGVLAADGSNGVGIKGVCGQCRIMPVRVLGAREGTSADVAAGIAWAADHGARVVNLSLSTASPSRLLQDAVQHAAGKGALVVASSGNMASTARRYPAAFDPALAVGSVYMAQKNTATDQWVDVSAYADFRALNPVGKMSSLPGTSGSTAIVSGVAGLALAMNPEASADQVRTAIQRGAYYLPTLPAFQAPLINAAQVVYEFGGTDTIAPTVTRTGLTENELIGFSGEMLTPAATDDHGLERIEVVVGSKVMNVINRPSVGKGPGPAVTIRPPAGLNGPTPVTVLAYDYAGNVGKATTVVQFDTVTPTGTIVSPTWQVIAHGDTTDVTVSSRDADLAFISSDRGGSLARVTGTELWKGKVALDWSGDFRLKLTDLAGNWKYLDGFVRVDNDPPTGGALTPASGKRVRGTFTSTLSNVIDLSGVAKTELWANGKYVGVDKTEPYALAVKTGTYTGKLTLLWKATDRWGQTLTLPQQSVTVDNTSPTVSITKAPKNKAKVKGTVKVAVKASDAAGVARVELLVNGKVVAKDTTSGYVLSVNTRKQKKTMKVQVRAYDRVGNVKYTTTRTWSRK
jgi:hypothetical protein